MEGNGRHDGSDGGAWKWGQRIQSQPIGLVARRRAEALLPQASCGRLGTKEEERNEGEEEDVG